MQDDSPSYAAPRQLSSPPSPRRRDFAPAWVSASVWSQGGESYCEQFSTTVGSAGQDLHRYTEGPARYLNGTPNTGSKAMLERTMHLSPRGRVTHGPLTGPGQETQRVMDRKLACKRSTVGPDPYGLGATNMWSPRPPQRAFAVFAPALPDASLRPRPDGTARQPWAYGRTATHAFDPCTRAAAARATPPPPARPHAVESAPMGRLSATHALAMPVCVQTT